MYRRGIILLLLAVVAAGSGQCALIEVPASQDVYISMGTGDERVYNETKTLLCAVDVTVVNNTTKKSYPGVPVIQFDISRVNITDDDVAILVLKAASVRQMERSNMVALLTIGSEWDEYSDMTTFLINILPARNLIDKKDVTQISTNSDGDDIYAFDVSQKLMQAKGGGDRISFLLEDFSNSTAAIDFYSMESGQGPYLIIMPYPGLLVSGQIEPVVQIDEVSEINQTGNIGEWNQTSQTDETAQPDQVLLPGSVPVETMPGQTFGFTAEGNLSQAEEMAASEVQTSQNPAQMQLVV